jgi:hypothetical protein
MYLFADFGLLIWADSPRVFHGCLAKGRGWLCLMISLCLLLDILQREALGEARRGDFLDIS